MSDEQGTPGKVLLVEDEKVMLTLIARLFQRGEFGVAVSTASTVRAGIELIEGNDFVLLVTDMSLPDGRGTDVIRRFRAKFPDAPIIVMSGSLTVESEVEAITGVSVQACLLKPFTVDIFHSAVAKALKS